jgi:hypothetical protein
MGATPKKGLNEISMLTSCNFWVENLHKLIADITVEVKHGTIEVLA